MAQEIADSKLIDTWSSDGLKVKPDISKIIEGWQLGEQPPHEYMNWLQNTFGSKLNHILKNGVASWNNETQYLAGSSVQHNGNVWICKATNTNSAPTDANANWKRTITVESLTTVLSGYVKNTGNETIAGVKTFSSSPIVPTPTTDNQVANKKYVDENKVTDIFSKPNYGALFIKTAPATISIPLGFQVVVDGKIITLTSDYSLSLNTNLDTGTKTPGKDYYVYATTAGSFYLSADGTKTTDKLIGGFHYGLTGETETRPAAALKTEADMVANRGIKAYSMWDLTWKPANKRPEGKVLVNNLFWRDIYPADENYGIRGYSSCFALNGVTPAKLAGGAETNGRKFPKIPLSKGGNGTLNYGSLTWFEANEIISEVGMRMISYDEFSNSSYGVVEQKSLSQLGYTIGTGTIQHYPELESKWGVEMAVGCQWFWTKELMNGYGTTDFANRTGLTDGRGYIYATSNSPVAGIVGGQEQHDSTYPVGSRALNLVHYVWDTYWSDGFVAVCDHMNLDK